jgi:hypothetical protein
MRKKQGEHTMSQFVGATLDDLRGGRQSWRVLLLLAIPAFLIGIVAGLVPLG